MPRLPTNRSSEPFPGAPRRRPGRPRGSRHRVQERTREALLDGALSLLARRPRGRLSMSDVSRRAGVSRGTAYRHFDDANALLSALGVREAERFERRVWDAMEAAPDGEGRLQVAFDLAAQLARSHPLLQQLPESDPALALRSLRERFPDIRAAFSRVFGPLLARTALVEAGLVTAEQLVDWTTRLLVSTYLFPDPELRDTATGLRAIYRLIDSPATTLAALAEPTIERTG